MFALLVALLDDFVVLSLLSLPQAANSRALQTRTAKLSGTRQLERDGMSLSSI
jgi:hypothetical protein